MRHSASTPRSEPPALHPALAQLVLTLAWTTVALLLMLALWLLARRLGGQLQSPLAGPVVLLVTAALLAMVSFPRAVCWHVLGRGPAAPLAAATALWLLPSLALLLISAALSITGTGAARLTLLWVPVLSTETLWWWLARRQLQRLRQPDSLALARSAADSPSTLPRSAPRRRNARKRNCRSRMMSASS